MSAHHTVSVKVACRWMGLLATLTSLLSVSFAATMSLSILVNHLGQYPSDFRLFSQPAFKNRMIRLMGTAAYQTLVANFAVQGPLSGTKTLVYLSGNKAHLGGSENSIVVYDANRDALKVWLKTSHHLITFEEEGWLKTRPFPQDLRTTVQNLYTNL